MNLRASGSTALLAEYEHLDEVLGHYAALSEDPPDGVVDLVPAARTILVVVDPARRPLEEVARDVRAIRPGDHLATAADEVEVEVRYDGEDLDEVAGLLGCDVAEVVRRHTSQLWTVAFCGFAPGFGYLASEDGEWDVPRRKSPRTKVPAGSVGLAGEFTGIYPRESPGGWQLIGSTTMTMFDPHREEPAVFRPGRRVRFVDSGAAGG